VLHNINPKLLEKRWVGSACITSSSACLSRCWLIHVACLCSAIGSAYARCLTVTGHGATPYFAQGPSLTDCAVLPACGWHSCLMAAVACMPKLPTSWASA
jgi:hypothetical protein